MEKAMQITCRLNAEEIEALCYLQNDLQFCGRPVSKSDVVKMALSEMARLLRTGEIVLNREGVKPKGVDLKLVSSKSAEGKKAT